MQSRRGRRQSLEKRILTTDDVWCNSAREACAKEAAKWLKASVNIRRPIDTLKLAELTGLVEAVVAHWIVLASHRPDEPEPTDKERDFIAGLS